MRLLKSCLFSFSIDVFNAIRLRVCCTYTRISYIIIQEHRDFVFYAFFLFLSLSSG